MERTVILVVFGLLLAYALFRILIQPRVALIKFNNMLKERRDHSIENITKLGFTFYDKQIPETIKWDQVMSIEFVTKDSLRIVLNNTKEIMIHPHCVGSLEFMKKVPPGISGYDYSYVENVFASFTPCKICGCFSTKAGRCLNCDYSEESEKTYKGENSDDAYIKQEQLDYLTTYFDNDESSEITLRKARESDLFRVDKNWKIYPTKQEITDAKKEMNK